LIDPDFKARTVQKKVEHVNEVKTALDTLSEEYNKVLTRLAEIEAIHKHCATLFTTMHGLEARIRFLDDNNRTIHTEIEFVEKEALENVDTSKLEEIRQQLATVNNELNEAKDDRATMNYAGILLKDSGVKAKIIKTFIPVMNQLINKYLAALDFFVEFQLNENFEEQIKSRFRDVFSYESFSEGEKVRLNLAILFAWRALAKLRGSIDCNLIVLDEILDSSLDSEGLDNMLQLINNLTNGQNVVIISHKTDQLSDRFTKVLHFEKKRNFSELMA
jgi:DNA repair exonuclease SbcCD ATPase subunit